MDTPPDHPTPAHDFRDLDPRHIRVERIGWLVFAAMVFVPGALVAALALALDWWALGITLIVAASTLLVTIAILWTAWRWPIVAYRATSYRVSPGGAEIRRGVFWRKVVNVPRSRIQHTNVTQGPLQRRFGLATLTIHTAGTHNAQVSLAGLSHADALAARDTLSSSEGDDGV